MNIARSYEAENLKYGLIYESTMYGDAYFGRMIKVQIENEPHTINTSLQPQKMIMIILMLSLEFYNYKQPM